MIKKSDFKKILALFCEKIYINNILHYSQKKLFYPYIRAINYHDVPPSEAHNFEKQLQLFADRFTTVDQNDLQQFHNFSWGKNRPGLIISFDDGYRSFHDVVAPLLEKYKMKGWFFISPALIDIPIHEQSLQANVHRVRINPKYHEASRIFLTWDEIKALDKKHIIGCHTLTHCRLSSSLSEEVLASEIINSKKILENKLNHDIESFAWVGGEEKAYCRRAAEIIRKSNYKYVFLTNNSLIKPQTNLHMLDRTNIESSFSIELLKFQLSGIMDILYTVKRRRVTSNLSR